MIDIYSNENENIIINNKKFEDITDFEVYFAENGEKMTKDDLMETIVNLIEYIQNY